MPNPINAIPTVCRNQSGNIALHAYQNQSDLNSHVPAGGCLLEALRFARIARNTSITPIITV